MNIAVVTSPYGFNLFYIRGTIPMIRDQIPEDITMRDLYHSVLPLYPPSDTWTGDSHATSSGSSLASGEDVLNKEVCLQERRAPARGN